MAIMTMSEHAPGAPIPVAVLGAGKVGRLVCQLLASSGDYAVTAVDFDPTSAEAAVIGPDGKPLEGSRHRTADFGDRAALTEVLEGQRYVVSCAPYHSNVGIARLAREMDLHYLDLTEDVATTKVVKELGQDSNTAFIPQCGLAPGFVSIVAHWLASSFEELESVKMRVGALPLYPHNRLKYNITWSTEGLINEYGNPCEAVQDGKMVTVPPLAGHEVFCIEGEDYEAFNTSGGLGTLAESWAGRVRNMDYKSIRYPGHRDIVALLMDDLKLNEDRDTLKRIFERALPHTHQDIVLVFVTATGWRKGVYSQEAFAKKIRHGDLVGRHWGAIQITTASGVCAVLDLHAAGALPAEGFVRQEDVPYEKFIANRFGKAFA